MFQDSPILPGLPRRYRLGSTSFVLPDHIVPNVEALCQRVDDVQLLLLEAEGDLPGPAEIARLDALRQQHGLSYSLHLPTLVALPGAPTESSAASIAAMLRLARPLQPRGSALHVVPAPPEQDDPLQRWIAQAAIGLQRIAELADWPVAELAVENQWAYDVRCNRALAERSGCSLCLDLGHMVYAGADPLPLLEQQLDRTALIHIHGVADRDHRSLEHFGPLREVLGALQHGDYRGVLTVEVFGSQPFEASLQALARAWPAAVGAGR